MNQFSSVGPHADVLRGGRGIEDSFGEVVNILTSIQFILSFCYYFMIKFWSKGCVALLYTIYSGVNWSRAFVEL